MLTKARLRDDVVPAELDYLTALRAPEIKALVEAGAIQLGLFDETDLFEIAHPDYQGERLVCCKNPLLAEERASKRASLLAGDRGRAQKDRRRRHAASAGRFGARTRSRSGVGRVVNRYKMAKHFDLEIGDDSFSFSREGAQIAAEAALDGIYVLRTSLSDEALSSRRGRLLLQVPRLRRAGVSGLQHRLGHPPDPPPHRGAGARARLFADALLLRHLPHGAGARADAVQRRRQGGGRGGSHEPGRPGAALGLGAFEDDDEEDRRATAGPQLQEPARRPRHDRRQPDQPTDAGVPAFTLVTTPTPVQRRAFELLGVSHRLGYA